LFDFIKIICRRKTIEGPGSADPPLAVTGLQRVSLVHPAEVYRSGIEPGKTLSIKSPQTDVVIIWCAPQRVQFCAFKDAGTFVAQNVASEADSACPVPENRIDGIQAIALVVSNKPLAFKFHRPGGGRSQPQVSAQIFVKRRDVIKAQTVSFAI